MTTTRSGKKHSISPDDGMAIIKNALPNLRAKRAKGALGTGASSVSSLPSKNNNDDDVVVVSSSPSKNNNDDAFSLLSSDTSAQAELDCIVSSLGNGVVWSELVEYGQLHGHHQGKAIECDAPTLMDVKGGVFMSFKPLRDDTEEPSKTLIQNTLWKMLVRHYDIISSEAIKHVNDIAWCECVPFVLPYDADRDGNQHKFEEILENTDCNMKLIHEEVIKSLPNLKAGLVLGSRATDFFIDEKIIPGRILSQPLKGKNLVHPEMFVCTRACTDERTAMLNAMSGFLSKILNVEERPISEHDMKFYLHSTPFDRAERHKKSVETKYANHNKKHEDARILEVTEEAARPALIQKLVDYGVESDDNFSCMSTRDLAAMNLSEMDKLRGPRLISKPPYPYNRVGVEPSSSSPFVAIIKYLPFMCMRFNRRRISERATRKYIEQERKIKKQNSRYFGPIFARSEMLGNIQLRRVELKQSRQGDDIRRFGTRTEHEK
jgi:hypothetical protein